MQVKKKKVDDNTYESYTSQKIQTLFFFFAINTFIQQGHIKLIQSNS